VSGRIVCLLLVINASFRYLLGETTQVGECLEAMFRSDVINLIGQLFLKYLKLTGDAPVRRKLVLIYCLSLF
jgi:hypothetical protein